MARNTRSLEVMTAVIPPLELKKRIHRCSRRPSREGVFVQRQVSRWPDLIQHSICRSITLCEHEPYTPTPFSAISPFESEELDPSLPERLADARQILQQLNTHPNIVSTYDMIEDEGRQYLVTELVESPTLEAILSGAHGEPLPVDRAVARAKAICAISAPFCTGWSPATLRQITISMRMGLRQGVHSVQAVRNGSRSSSEAFWTKTRQGGPNLPPRFTEFSMRSKWTDTEQERAARRPMVLRRGCSSAGNRKPTGLSPLSRRPSRATDGWLCSPESRGSARRDPCSATAWRSRIRTVSPLRFGHPASEDRIGFPAVVDRAG